MGFAETLQNTALAKWVSQSGSLLGYPTVLFLHTIGLATLAGLNACINLRVLGIARSLPLAPMSKLFGIMWTALVVTTMSGVALFVADAVTRSAQLIFWLKLLFVILAMVNLQLLKTRVLDHSMVDKLPPDNTAKLLAATSMLLLLAATTAGRLLAYVT